MSKEILQNDGAKLALYRDGPAWDKVPTMTIGDFTAKSEEAAKALLDQAVLRVQEAGVARVLGPMSGDTWHSYRYQTGGDKSAPFLMEPPSRPLELSALRHVGFETISRYFSARMLISTITPEPPPKSDAFSIETWDGADPEDLFAQVFSLSTQAFSGNAFYKPIDQADFLALYLPFVPMMKRDLIFFARRPDGSLAGFLFAIPNYAEGLQSKTVILKTYASLERGAGRHLVHACNTAARALGYDTIIHALIHDDNQSADRSAAEGAELFRRYELLGLRLDG